MPRSVPVLPGIQPSKSAYSQVVEANGFVFVAGQVGDDHATGEVAPGGIEAQTRAMFANVERCLATRACTYASVAANRPADTTTYDDTIPAASSAGPYSYRIQACNASGCSGWATAANVNVP